MARALSLLFSNILGSVGGLTYFNGPFHQIQIRQRTNPVQPDSVYQIAMRAAFAEAVAVWGALSKAIRDDWSVYASTVVYSGPLGNYSPSGRMLAIGQYAAVRYLNDTHGYNFPGGVSMTAPVIMNQPVLTGLVVSAPAIPSTGFDVDFVNDTTESIIVDAVISAQKGLAVNFWKGPFDSTQHQGVAVDHGNSGNMPFASLVDGAKYFVKVRSYSAEAGRRFTTDVIMEAIASTTV